MKALTFILALGLLLIGQSINSQWLTVRKVIILNNTDSITAPIIYPGAKLIEMHIFPDTCTVGWEDSVYVLRRIISKADTSGAPYDTTFIQMGLRWLGPNTDTLGLITSNPIGQSILVFDPLPGYKPGTSDVNYSDAILFWLSNAKYVTRFWKCVLDISY